MCVKLKDKELPAFSEKSEDEVAAIDATIKIPGMFIQGIDSKITCSM